MKIYVISKNYLSYDELTLKVFKAFQLKGDAEKFVEESKQKDVECNRLYKIICDTTKEENPQPKIPSQPYYLIEQEKYNKEYNEYKQDLSDWHERHALAWEVIKKQTVPESLLEYFNENFSNYWDYQIDEIEVE
jgi:hypothetical protein